VEAEKKETKKLRGFKQKFSTYNCRLWRDCTEQYSAVVDVGLWYIRFHWYDIESVDLTSQKLHHFFSVEIWKLLTNSAFSFSSTALLFYLSRLSHQGEEKRLHIASAGFYRSYCCCCPTSKLQMNTGAFQLLSNFNPLQRQRHRSFYYCLKRCTNEWHKTVKTQNLIL